VQIFLIVARRLCNPPTSETEGRLRNPTEFGHEAVASLKNTSPKVFPFWTLAGTASIGATCIHSFKIKEKLKQISEPSRLKTKERKKNIVLF
jgi:hypothetical protein